MPRRSVQLGLGGPLGLAFAPCEHVEHFHEAGEGLGILCRLPLAPGGPEARTLLATLSQMV